MNRRRTMLIREGEYVIEVEVELGDSPEGWGPYLSLADAQRLGPGAGGAAPRRPAGGGAPRV
jgi:hypothetical protein